MFLSRIRLWAPSKHAGCSISSGIYVVTAEAETGCPRPPGRFPAGARVTPAAATVLPGPARPCCNPATRSERGMTPEPPGISNPAMAPERASTGGRDATKTLGGQRIRPCRRVAGRVAHPRGAFSPARGSWRPAAPQIRHCAGRHRVPVAKPAPPMASGIPNPVTAAVSWLEHASTGSFLGTGGAIGLGMVGFLTAAAVPGRRAIWANQHAGFQVFRKPQTDHSVSRPVVGLGVGRGSLPPAVGLRTE
jgi:hypothetical protein